LLMIHCVVGNVIPPKVLRNGVNPWRGTVSSTKDLVFRIDVVQEAVGGHDALSL
ncbi:Hypothetical protein FKW44_022371, partial [Caligus rogercresseyi]